MTHAPTALDPLFTAELADELTARALGNLLAGTLGVLSVPDFLTSDDCTQALGALDRLPHQTYDTDRVERLIGRFGPALNDHRRGQDLDTRAYWTHVDQAQERWATLDLDTDPLQALLNGIGTAWGSPVVPATIGGRPVWGVTIREINSGTLVHYDELVRECPHVLDQDVIGQIAVNAWASTPTSGGETWVWRQRWQPSDQRFSSGYGYHDVVAFNAQRLTVAPQLGALQLFSPSWYHRVTPVQAGRRISLSCFLGYTLTGQLVCWS